MTAVKPSKSHPWGWSKNPMKKKPAKKSMPSDKKPSGKKPMKGMNPFAKKGGY